jgi:hypothetical protein
MSNKITAEQLIAAERIRQREKGYTAAADLAKYKPDVLAFSGGCFALAPFFKTMDLYGCDSAMDLITFRAHYWRPHHSWSHSRLEQLVIAGAYIAAEIDRILLEQEQAQQNPKP